MPTFGTRGGGSSLTLAWVSKGTGERVDCRKKSKRPAWSSFYPSVCGEGEVTFPPNKHKIRRVILIHNSELKEFILHILSA
jgi:hypothetical protein